MNSYASYTRQTTEPIKALAHSRRFSQAVQILSVLPADIFLDYGCADAHLFSMTNAAVTVGYEPDPKMVGQTDPALLSSITLYTDLSKLILEYAGKFTIISCMEVCEHLTPPALDILLTSILALSAPGARVVFGVPIETGLSGFLKGIYRTYKERRQEASFLNSLKSLVGIEIQRRESDVEWFGSHIGFNDRLFAMELIRRGFTIRSKRCLPLPIGRLLNNEIYYICAAP